MTSLSSKNEEHRRLRGLPVSPGKDNGASGVCHQGTALVVDARFSLWFAVTAFESWNVVQAMNSWGCSPQLHCDGEL